MLLNAPIQHRNFVRALNQAKTIATHGPPNSITFVCGPSGGGKSTLKEHLAKDLYGPPCKWPEHKSLLIAARATNSEGGYFSSKDFFIRALTILGDPFRGGKAETAVAAIVGDEKSELLQFLSDPLWRSMRISMTETRIRRAFECLAVALGLKSFFIDEGQSMCLTHLNRSPSDHLESLKCLAEEIGIQIFIFGTYNLLEIWNHSSQLNRRMHLVHLARYDRVHKEDCEVFFSVLRMLGKALPIHLEVLSKHASEIMDWTLGVFGEAEALLSRARIAALADGREQIAWRHIEQSVYTPAQMKRLANEIELGEARVAGKVNKPTESKPGGTSSRGNKRPGRRKPGRDKCGDAE